MEGGILSRERGDPVLGKAETERAGLFAEQGAGDELGQDEIVDAERRRLLARQPLAETLRQLVYLAVIGEAILVDGNRCTAGGDNGIAAKSAAKLPRDTPDREAEHKQQKQQLRYPCAGRGSQ